MSGRAPSVRRAALETMVPALGLAGLLSLVFAAALSPDRVFFQRDIQAYWYPQFDSLARSFAEGSWPVWNPHVAFGVPMLAEPAYQVLYPFAWLNLVLPPELYYKLYVLAHALVAGLGTRRLALRAGLSPAAAFLAAAAYMLSGPFVSLVSMTHHFAGAAWLPWVVLAFEVALQDGTRRASLNLGLAAGVQALAGSADMCLMAGLLAAGRGVIFVVRAPAAPSSAARRCVWVSLTGGLAAFLLSAAQWLPTLALIGSTTRAAMDEASRTYWSLHPLLALEMVFPGLTTLPLATAFRHVALEGREPFLASVYLGAGALVLAALGVSGETGHRARSWLAGVALFVLVALGRFAPIYPLMLAVPGAGLIRFPVKYLVPAALLFALATGLGLQAFLARVARRPSAASPLLAALGVLLIALAGLLLLRESWLAGWLFAPSPAGDGFARASRSLLRSALVALSTALVLAAGLRRPRGRTALGVLLAALVLGDLAAAARGVNLLAPAELLRHRPALLDRLEGTREEERVHVIGYPTAWLVGQLARGPANWEPEARWALGLQDMLSPPIGARWGLRGSYDGDFTGLASPALAVVGGLLQRHPDDAFGRRLLEMGNVGRVIGLQPRVFGGLPELSSVRSVFALPIRLFAVPGRLPRAYVVGHARRVDPPGAFLALADPSFDPRTELILPTPTRVRPPRPGFNGRARVVSSRMDSVEVEAELSDDGFLVLVEAFDPGWRATVDGMPAEVMRANVLFRAVALPPGRHTVLLRYRPPAVLAGLVVSVLAWLGLAVAQLPLRRAAAPTGQP